MGMWGKPNFLHPRFNLADVIHHHPNVVQARQAIIAVRRRRSVGTIQSNIADLTADMYQLTTAERSTLPAHWSLKNLAHLSSGFTGVRDSKINML